MRDEWQKTQDDTYLIVGLLLPFFAGFLVGSAVAIATQSIPLGVLIGLGMWVWCLVIYFEGHE